MVGPVKAPEMRNVPLRQTQFSTPSRQQLHSTGAQSLLLHNHRRNVPRAAWFLLLSVFLVMGAGVTGCGYFSASNVANASLSLPSNVAFGSVTVGQQSTLKVALANNGGSPVTIFQVNVSGKAFSVTGVGTLPITLAPGSSLSLALQFDPTAAGPSTGSLTVASNSAGSPQAVVSLTGTGATASATPVATLSVSPSNIAFGNIGLNFTATQNVTLSSTGTTPVTVNSATVTGTGFTLASASLPATLNPGQTLTLTVLFNPLALTAYGGQLSIVSNSSTNPTVQLNLSGTGISASGLAAMTVNPVSVAFGSVTVNSSGSQSVTLVSSGNSPLTINSAIVSGTGFTLMAATFPATLNPGQSLTLGLQFSPTAAGTATGQLTVVSNSSTGGTVVVPLSGTGITSTAASGLAVNPGSIAFGSIAVNNSMTQTLILSSSGSAPVTVSGLTVSGAGFSLSGASAPFTINPGQSVSLTVQFSPTAAGAATGQITITSSSATGGTIVVGLSGTATQHLVDLAWNAPAASPDPLAGYHVYRSLSGANSYQFLGTVDISITTYSDTTVQSGISYDYVVKSIDTSGVESAPSNTTSVAIP